MIYLKNTTEEQECYIPRQDEIYGQGDGSHCGSYSEGYSDGFDDGFDSGSTAEKNRLSAITITQNTSIVKNRGGYSAITVNVPQTGGTGNFENKTVIIGTDITTVTPSSGFDAMSAVTVDASEYAQTNYDNGFDDGFDDGYASGSTDEKAKLSAVTFTANTAVTLSDGGYNAVTVNVPTSGGSANIGSGSFYGNGKYYSENDGLDGYSAVTIDVDNDKVSGGESISISANGTTVIRPRSYGIDFVQSKKKVKITANGYRQEAYIGHIEDKFLNVGYIDVLWDGGGLDYDDTYWSGERLYVSYTGNTIMEIEVDDSSYYLDFVLDGDTGGTYDGMSLVHIDVNVDTATTYQSGFTDGYDSGYSDGSQSIIDTFTSTTINHNGVYGNSAHPFTSVTVNVPTSGGTSILGSGSFSANGTYSATSENLDGYNVVTIDVPQDYTQEDIDNAYESGYTDCLGSLETVSFSANGIYNAESGEGWNKVIVNVPTSGSSAILGELNASQDGVYIAENDGLDGYSAVTVNTSSNSHYGELYALYCVDASLGEFTYSDTWENRTADCYSIPFMVYPLSDVHIKISGKYRNSNVLRDLQIQYDPSGCPFTINYDGVEKTGRLRAVSSLDEFNSFSFYNRQTNEAIFEYVEENGYTDVHFPHAMKMEKRAIGISGSCFYLLNYFDCFYHVGIDSNGRAFYRDQKNIYYPTAGNCYPVFRKLVNGVYKYKIVNAFTAPTTP